MYSLSIVSVAAWLVLATALPHPGLKLSIALEKKSSLIKNWIVDLGATRAHIALSEEKYWRGVAALERNRVRTTNSRRTSSNPFARRAAGSAPLTDNGNDRWYGTISVGTPPVDFKVDVDTGSADLFLPASNCDSTCNGHTLYTPNVSSSAIDLHQTFSLAYGDNSTGSGEQYADTVTIAGFVIKNQTFGAATHFSSGFQTPNFAPDGLMGMAFPTLSYFPANPVIQTLIAESQLTDQVFAFKLASSGSELLIGGVNSALYTGSFTYTPVTEQAFWSIKGDAINANGQAVITNFSAIVDTGTTLILGDAETVSQFYAPLNATNVGGGFYTMPCNSMPNVSITIEGKPFALSAETFNFGSYDASGQSCVGAIAGTGSLGSTWILGDIFLRNVYTVFDIGQKRVGFADLA